MASTRSRPAASADAWHEALAGELAELDAAALRRSVVTPESGQGPRVKIDGQLLLNFTSNNYLGLATDPRVIEGAVEAARRYGASVSASRLLAGSTPLHDALERRLAALKGCEAALLFSAGYLANLGVLTALAGPDVEVFSDELNHASIVDGCRLARAQASIYRHRDLAHLEQLLEQSDAARRLIVTESVFSMDGDLLALPELLAIAERHGALVVIDEAHATGVLGDGGAGALSHFGIDPAGLAVPLVIVGTLSKALGSVGGFVAADETVIAYLLNRARSFIFNTALPPAAVGAAHAALDVIEAEPRRGERVQALGERLRAGFIAAGYSTGPSQTQIVPLLLGEAEVALTMEHELRAAGVFAKAIRPPTVPPGTSRIRFNVMATHDEADIDRVVAAVGRADG